MATSSPILTVAIPTFNGEAHLGQTLLGILAQEGAAFDLLICDERSEDRTLDIVREFAGDRARILVNSERLGLAGNWNRCVELSRTPWVAIFHQDDLMRPGHLRDHLEAIGRSDDRTGLIAGESDVIDEVGNPVPYQRVEYGGAPISGVMPHDLRFLPFGPDHELMWGFVAASNGLRCSAVTTRKEAHADVGGFAPRLRYVVDWDFWYRVIRRWGVTWVVWPTTVSVRWHLGSETHRFKTGFDDIEETESLIRSHLEDEGIADRGRSLVELKAMRRLARAYLNRAHDALKAGHPEQAREGLRRAAARSPRVVARAFLDPRLAIQMGALTVAPAWAGRRFARADRG